jgi:transcriptional regulator with XRE-family HTH domain
MKAPVLRALGLRILKLRGDRDWTREEFAEMVHVDPKHIYDLELGKAEPGFLVLGSICETLGCDWNMLMEGITGMREACEERRKTLASV